MIVIRRMENEDIRKATTVKKMTAALRPLYQLS